MPAPLCVVNWPLVLEFTKVLAAPVLSLFGAIWISRLAVRTFIAQKSFERRVEWYVAIHRAITTLPVACNHWAHAVARGNDLEIERRKDDAMAAQRGLAQLGTDGVLFASPRALDAVKRLTGKLSGTGSMLADLIERPTWQTAHPIEVACTEAGLAIADEMRQAMGSSVLGELSRRERLRRLLFGSARTPR